MEDIDNHVDYHEPSEKSIQIKEETGFYGFYWTELIHALDVEIDQDGIFEDHDKRERVLEELRSYIEDLAFSEDVISGEETVEEVQYIRDYVDALIRQQKNIGTIGVEIWEALLAVEDDFTFTKYFASILEHASS
jgi:hypothetical protein